MSPRRFRFAVQLTSASSRDDWRRQARLAEDVGYSVCVMPDHIGSHLAPFPALMAIADATRSIRIGTFVLDNDFRHPLLVAEEASTLDLLTDGRLELGLGAGWHGADYRQLGMAFDPPDVRLQRLTESVEILELYFTGERFSFHGAHYEIDDAQPNPLPRQRPRPRLLIGGGGRRILELAGRHADIVSVFLTSRRDGAPVSMWPRPSRGRSPRRLPGSERRPETEPIGSSSTSCSSTSR